MRSAWFLFMNVGYLILILLVSYIVFTVPAQTEDFIYLFLQDFDLGYVLAVYFTLFVWSMITWYSACINLQIDPIKGSFDLRGSRAHKRLLLWFPRVLGIMPYIIFALAVRAVDHVTANNHRVFHLVWCGIFVLLMWAVFTFIDQNATRTSRQQKKKKETGDEDEGCANRMSDYKTYPGLWPLLKSFFHKPLSNWPTFDEVYLFKRRTKFKPKIWQELVFIREFSGVRFYYLVMGLFCLIVTLLMSIPPVIFLLSDILRPGAVLILSLACFTLLFTIIAYFHDYSRRPFGIIVLIAIIVFSYFNDNTSLNYMKNDKATKRMEIRPAFEGWLAEKKNAWTDKTKKMPIIFIATQGGGIRGLTWTTRVLHHLDSTYPGFMNQTFLISGVSGGGVGATAYLSWLHDKQNGRAQSYHKFNEFTKKDFLSPLTASFTFGDNLQKFLPVPVSALDRSKILGETWERAYADCNGETNSFADSFLNMWYDDSNTFNYNIPSLMLNGTLAENGQRVVTSNLKLDANDNKWFGADIDFFAFTEKDISRSTAALNCSRFPFITSGAMLENDTLRKGHIVDGGYRENTGLQTLLNVFYTIRPVIKDDKDIKIVILYLQNGTDELNNDVTASRIFQDVMTPLKGIYQVNGTGMPAKSIVQFVQQTCDTLVHANVRFSVLSLENRKALDPKTQREKDSTHIKLPLGWYMSEVVSKEIDRRVREIPLRDKVMIAELKQCFGQKNLAKE